MAFRMPFTDPSRAAWQSGDKSDSLRRDRNHRHPRHRPGQLPQGTRL